MKSQIFVIYDSKAEAYLQPFFLPTTGMAVRTFTDTVNDINHPFCAHPADYTLFHIGEFDDSNSKFTQLEIHKNLGAGHEYKTQIEIEMDDNQEELPNILKKQAD